MKLKLIITCFLCSIAFGFAQNSGTIKGKVIDKKTNEPLPYVNIILKDILLCKELGFEGVVFGLLNQDGTIDKESTAKLVAAAYPMEVTFHRAFDRCKLPYEALETLIECGCNRVLTSGQMPKVTDGINMVKKLVEQADNRIIILPGSGLNSSNVVNIIKETGVTEVHTSARIRVASSTLFRNEQMPEDFDLDFVDAAEIQQINIAISL